jgi:NAD-dependent dihydropyrimidine dehydrogenase PreA subunit
MRWCLRGSDQTTLRASFLQDVDRRIARNVVDDDSYLDLLTGRRAFANGPLAHFYRHLTKLPRFVKMDPSAVDPAVLPADLTFAGVDDWREVRLDDDESGVLTSPAYLLRFQSNRARANRFYNAFLCQPFQPPAGGIELVPGATDPDLQKRAGCKYCHAVLEPAAAHWGRSTEYGGGHLASALYPAVRDDCRRCALSGSACSDDCNRFYLTKAATEEERAWLGTFRPYVFRSAEHVRNVENGPRLLVLSSVVDGRLQGCVARTTAEWLLGRPLGVNEADVVDGYVRAFEDSGFSYRSLVKAIVTSDLYRRVR